MTPNDIAEKLVTDHFAVEGYSINKPKLVEAIAAVLARAPRCDALTVEALRSSGNAEHHDSGTWSAGIDAMRQYPYCDKQWHLHAIEFHHKDKAEAERLRDLALSVLSRGLVQAPLDLDADAAAFHKDRMQAALEKIACPHVTESPLWWQLEARAALGQCSTGTAPTQSLSYADLNHPGTGDRTGSTGPATGGPKL